MAIPREVYYKLKNGLPSNSKEVLVVQGSGGSTRKEYSPLPPIFQLINKPRRDYTLAPSKLYVKKDEDIVHANRKIWNNRTRHG